MKDCASIQEQIAWDAQLPEAIQMHVLSCIDCNRIAMEFASLNSWVSEHLETSIPEGFADAVMARITSQVGAAPDVPSLRVSRKFSSPWMQAALFAAGCVIAILNLIRFVLVVVLPVLT